MCESEFLYFKVRLYITNQYWKIQKKIQLQNKWFEKKGFQEGLQLQNGWFEEKICAKGQATARSITLMSRQSEPLALT